MVMKRSFAFFLVAFLVLPALTTSVGYPVVFLDDPHEITFTPILPSSTDLYDLSSFSIVTDGSGYYSEDFHNLTGELITEFHFWFSSSTVSTGGLDLYGSPYFSTLSLISLGGNDWHAMASQGSGTGIPYGAYFNLTLEDFPAECSITAQPGATTPAPTPGAILLVGLGAATVGVLRRRKML